MQFGLLSFVLYQSREHAALAWVQAGGALLSVFVLLGVAVHFRRQYSDASRRLSETDAVLATIGEGLFLLERDGRMAPRQSSTLERIFGRADLAQADFFSLLRDRVTEKTLAVAKDYVELLFQDRVHEKLVTTVNPLDAVEVHLPDGQGGLQARYLEFRFSRVRSDGRIRQLLVTVGDITRRAQLERELQRSEERASGQLELMVQLAHLDSAELMGFLQRAAAALEQVNAELRSPLPRGSQELRGKTEAMARTLHAIKGDAGGLGLNSLAAAVHEAEDELQLLRARRSLGGGDFLKLAVRLKTLFARIEAMQDMALRVMELRDAGAVSPDGPTRVPSVAFALRWRDFARTIAARHGKKVELVYRGVDLAEVDPARREALVTIVNQFIRNAIVHGIEPPTQRIRMGKPGAGQIEVHVAEKSDRSLDLRFGDDGAGLSLDRLRAQAVQRGMLSPGTAGAADARRLLNLIFAAGFSTRQQVDEDGGRGAGLNLVRVRVAHLGGRVSVGNRPGEGCEFHVGLPPVRCARAMREPAEGRRA
ncbi:MAG: sensor histidine kinase [Gammaproteobacteria bacterium]|nr:sensor histidine kinase [Gammaproteobacteria bacterium]